MSHNYLHFVRLVAVAVVVKILMGIQFGVFSTGSTPQYW